MREIFIVTLIVLGAIIMLFSIWRTRKLLVLLDRHKHIIYWRFLVWMMMLFLGGYVATAFFVMAQLSEVLLFLIGGVFFGGAMFVYLVVQLEYSTLGDILQIIEQRKNAEQSLEQHRNELEEMVNHRTSELTKTNIQMQQLGVQVASSATELAATVKEQRKSVEQQVSLVLNAEQSVTEIGNVMKELLATMQGVASIAEAFSPDFDRLATTTEHAAQETDLERMETAMRNMAKASKTVYNKLGAISEKAGSITSVITTITKVADQTDLLSLNAAIEAEKAGEYGRGFTIVAREIRRLADQTAIATLDIKHMVNGMQAAVSSGVKEMDRFLNDVQHSVEDVQNISGKLTIIIEQVQALSPSFESVNASMAQLSGQMRQTKISLNETFQAIEQLNEIAQYLGESY